MYIRDLPQPLRDVALEACESRFHNDDFSPRDMFELLLEYEGFFGYTTQLISWYRGCHQEVYRVGPQLYYARSAAINAAYETDQMIEVLEIK